MFLLLFLNYFFITYFTTMFITIFTTYFTNILLLFLVREFFCPMEIQKFKEISTAVYTNIQALTPLDIDTLKDILCLKTIKYGRIRTFSIEDSQNIILLTLKQNCLILLKFLLENGIELQNSILDAVIELLFANTKVSMENGKADINAQIEMEKIEEQIYNNIVDIIAITSYSNEKLRNFLASKNVPDDASINFAHIVDCEYKSFELIVLNKVAIGPVLLNLVKSYKNKLRPIIKKKIINNLVSTLSINYSQKNNTEQENLKIIYEIFYLINNYEHNDLLRKSVSDHSIEYLGMVSSLILNKESADIAYEKLNSFLEEFEYAISVLISESKKEIRKLHPSDAQMIERALLCISKLINYKTVYFYKFIQSFQSLIKLNVGPKIKGILYEILTFYVYDKDIFIEGYIDCKNDVESEIKSHEFYLLPRLIKFINAYSDRESIEKDLLAQGKSLGSPYATSNILSTNISYLSKNEKNIDYKVFGLKSEDPETVIECFDSFISEETIKLNAVSIRNAMIKDQKVTEKIILYQIEKNFVIDDISIVNMILCTPCEQFFDYVRLFNDFSFYLNGDLLERISDDLENGLKWIGDSYNREIGKWMLKNCNYFNDILKSNPEVQNKLIPVYSKILDENISFAEILPFTENDSVFDTFYVNDDAEELTDEFFMIFAKQILYAKYYTNTDPARFLLKKKYSVDGFTIYLKAKLIAGFEIDSDIKYMKANLADTDEILGYLKIVSESSTFETENRPSANILLNFGIKDSCYFKKYFYGASDLEKFILFFSIDTVDKTIDSMIKEEIIRNLRSKNKIYLTMCVIQLFKCKGLDNILKALETCFDDKDLLFKLNIYNIATGGWYCSKTLIHHADSSLVHKAIFLLYYLDIWEKDYIIELMNKMEVELDEDMKYLANDIKNY